MYSERDHVLSSTSSSWTLAGLVYENNSKLGSTQDKETLGLRAGARVREYSGLKQSRSRPKEDIHSGKQDKEQRGSN